MPIIWSKPAKNLSPIIHRIQYKTKLKSYTFYYFLFNLQVQYDTRPYKYKYVIFNNLLYNLTAQNTKITQLYKYSYIIMKQICFINTHLEKKNIVYSMHLELKICKCMISNFIYISLHAWRGLSPSISYLIKIFLYILWFIIFIFF